MPVLRPGGTVTSSTEEGETKGEDFNEDVFEFKDLQRQSGDVDIDADEETTLDEPADLAEATSYVSST